MSSGACESPLTRTQDSRYIGRKLADKEFNLGDLLCSTTSKLVFTHDACMFGGTSPFVSVFVTFGMTDLRSGRKF